MSDILLTQSLEWLNGNMHRNYPLVDGAVPKSRSGEYLPASFLVDLHVVVPFIEGLDSSKFFVSSIVRQPSAIQVTIGYMIDTATGRGFDCAISSGIPLDIEFSGTTDPYEADLAAVTEVNPAIPAGSYTHGIPDAYAALRNLRGKLYIGSCVDVANIGELAFGYSATALIPQCIFIETPITTVSSIRFLDTYGTDKTFTDDITIKAGDGIVFEVNENEVICSLDPTYMKQLVQARINDIFKNAITNINGALPDANGNLIIAGLDCTLLESEYNGISISNPCAKPCCDAGGADSAEIQTALEGLQEAKTVLNDYYTDLATKVNTMQARLSSLIASRS